MPRISIERTANTILVVEDDSFTSQILANHLQKYGTVIKTINPSEAVANYMVHQPDIVFLDINYRNEDEDGFDILKRILSANEKAFVVMISSDANQNNIAKASGLGAQGFIPKPVCAEDFTYYINKFREGAC